MTGDYDFSEKGSDTFKGGRGDMGQLFHIFTGKNKRGALGRGDWINRFDEWKDNFIFIIMMRWKDGWM
jgi:hypothetical protein